MDNEPLHLCIALTLGVSKLFQIDITFLDVRLVIAVIFLVFLYFCVVF